MGNTEVPKMELKDAMTAAEKSVNVSKRDIPDKQRLKIEALETSILEITKNKSIREEFAKLGNKNQSPESIIATIKFHYERPHMQGEAGTAELEQITSLALIKLENLKSELLTAGGTIEQSDRRYAEVMAEARGKVAMTEPKEMPENMDAVQELLGSHSREKMENAVDLNTSLLVQLRNPENTVKYLGAKSVYATLSGGLNMEDAVPSLDAAFKTGIEKVRKIADPTKAGAEMMKLYATQLKAMGGLFNIMITALYPIKKHEELADDEHLKEGEGISDEEMAQVLDLILVKMKVKQGSEYKESKDIPEYMNQMTRVMPAYLYYREAVTGIGSNEGVSNVMGQELGVTQGAVNCLVGAFDLGYGIGTFFNNKITGKGTPHKEESKSQPLAARVYEFGKKIFKTETWKNLGSMLSYGIDRTSQAEKTFILSQMITELMGIALVGSEAGHSVAHFLRAENLGGIASKFTSLSGIPQIGEALAASEFIAANCPVLFEYGTSTAKIGRNLTSTAADLGEMWNTTVRIAHEAHSVHHLAESAYGKTVEQAEEADEEVKSENEKMEATPLYDELRQVNGNINLALKNANSIGFDAKTIALLKVQQAEIAKKLTK